METQELAQKHRVAQDITPGSRLLQYKEKEYFKSKKGNIIAVHLFGDTDKVKDWFKVIGFKLYATKLTEGQWYKLSTDEELITVAELQIQPHDEIISK